MPEVRTQTQTIFNNIRDPSVSDAVLEDFNSDDMTGHDDFPPNWIQSEALNLLNRIAQQCETGVQGKRIILAGHGFGGIVIKQVRECPLDLMFIIEGLLKSGQAILIANTTPRFYHVALSIASLVFFATPHRSIEDITWEQAMLELIQGDGTCRSCRYRSRPSDMVSVLADFVSQLSHVFYRFASKYPISNFVYGRHAIIQQFRSNFETVVFWEQYVDSDRRSLNNYESLRRHFSPLYIPPSSHHSPGMFDFHHCDGSLPEICYSNAHVSD